MKRFEPQNTMALAIRSARPSDLAAVDALLARSYPKQLKADYPPSVLVTAVQIISRARPGLLACGTYYVAETAEGQIVGAGGWTPDRRQRALGHVRHLVTDDRLLRRGVARALLGHSFDAARQARIAALECWSTFTAVPFYRAMGFETLGDIEVPLAPGISFPSKRMLRRL